MFSSENLLKRGSSVYLLLVGSTNTTCMLHWQQAATASISRSNRFLLCEDKQMSTPQYPGVE